VDLSDDDRSCSAIVALTGIRDHSGTTALFHLAMVTTKISQKFLFYPIFSVVSPAGLEPATP
jgi:hypothetical protein